MQRLSRLLSTLFYLGYFPAIPGTMASLCGVGIFILLKSNYPVLLYLTGLILLLGFYSAGATERFLQKKDAQVIVIDEVAGMLLCLVFLPQAKIKILTSLLIFLVFRIFDWAKPWPIRNAQKLPGSLGIMLDDIFAALYTNTIFQVFFRFAS